MKTERLLLRRFTAADRAPFAAMNADARVMRHFPALLTQAESDAMVDRIEMHFLEHGYGLWAAELSSTAEFIGFIGLIVPTWEAAFTPCVEIGWRLRTGHWGQGLATEGARAVVQHSFTELDLRELVSLTVPANRPSRRVMEKLGFARDAAGDFYHPQLPAGHPLRPHVLYRLRRAEWCATLKPLPHA